MLHLRKTLREDIKSEYVSHDNIFLQVCKDGELDVVKAMVERTQVDLEAREYGMTPLLRATHQGHLHVVQYLCEVGAAKEARSADDWTPLHCAAHQGHPPVVQYLCEQGADKEARDNCGETPLRFSAEEGRLAVVQYLWEVGADKEEIDWWGNTPTTTKRRGHGESDYLEKTSTSKVQSSAPDTYSVTRARGLRLQRPSAM